MMILLEVQKNVDNVDNFSPIPTYVDNVETTYEEWGNEFNS